MYLVGGGEGPILQYPAQQAFGWSCLHVGYGELSTFSSQSQAQLKIGDKKKSAWISFSHIFR